MSNHKLILLECRRKVLVSNATLLLNSAITNEGELSDKFDSFVMVLVEKKTCLFELFAFKVVTMCSILNLYLE